MPLALRPSLLRAADALLACDDAASATAAADALYAVCVSAYGDMLFQCVNIAADETQQRIDRAAAPSPGAQRCAGSL
jgi:predicted ATPase